MKKQQGASPQQHGKSESEQELHQSKTANQKVSKNFATATRDIGEQQELHHNHNSTNNNNNNKNALQH